MSTLTGTQVLLLIASETGNVYTFATPKLQALITKNEGKTLIQSCLNPESGADASQSPTTATPSRMISQDPSTNKQHTSAFKVLLCAQQEVDHYRNPTLRKHAK